MGLLHMEVVKAPLCNGFHNERRKWEHAVAVNPRGLRISLHLANQAKKNIKSPHSVTARIDARSFLKKVFPSVGPRIETPQKLQ